MITSGLERLEIKPRVGLGAVRFGMSMADAESVLGQAFERESYEDGDIHLYYPDLGAPLFFRAEEGWRLAGIEVDNNGRFALFGLDLLAKNRLQILEFLEAKGFSSDRDRVIHLEPLGGTRMSSKELAMDFYFDAKGSLLEVNWGVGVDENDEIPWPS